MAQQPPGPPPLAVPMPVLQGQPMPAIIDTRRHLQVISASDGIAQRFKDKVPQKLECIAHWLRSIRASFKRIGYGVHWLDRVQVDGPGQPAQIVSVTVPMTVVFDFPNPASVRQRVVLPGGRIVFLPVPQDVLNEISSQIYNFVLPLIERQNRKLYEGVSEDDGWTLVARIKSTEAELGNYLDLLENKRDDLKCSSFNDYPAFKAAVLQLKLDWQLAIDSSLIDADEDWPLSKVKRFVADHLVPLLGDGIAEWVEKPANRLKTLEETFEEADAIYKAKVRRFKNKRKHASAQLAAIAAGPDPVGDVDDMTDALSAEELQLYTRAAQGSSSRPAQRARQASSTDSDRPPSWLQPMMTAMAATFAQALSHSQQSWRQAPRGDDERGRGRGEATHRGGKGGRGGRGGRRGGRRHRPLPPQQHLHDFDDHFGDEALDDFNARGDDFGLHDARAADE